MMADKQTVESADARAGSGSRRWVALGAAALGLVALAAGLAWWAPWSEDAPAGTRLALTGDLATHDPALVVGGDGEDWYVYSTGGREAAGSPVIRRSTNGLHWETAGTVWDGTTRPEWAYEEIPGVSNFWAPELYEHDGTWYLYYSASTFGSNRSLIGLMTSPTLDQDDPAYGWSDQGKVWESTPGETNYNAIDPGIVEDADGTPWMAFGSFWGGIQMIELAWPSGLAAEGAEPITLATRNNAENAIEAPYIIERDGWYYLFVSRDKCCSGLDSTYSIAVGRSDSVTGPYVDSTGVDMLYDGGDVVLTTRGDMVGPGGQSVSQDHLGLHYYDGTNGGMFRLDIRELAWTDDGWPVAWTADELDGE